ncbi:MAG: hypothetical protein ACE5IH_07115 [Thermodesulfobacteriota bacterium]
MEYWSRETSQISEAQFQQIDSLHYEVENKLLRLVESLEKERDNDDWVNHIAEKTEEYFK